MTAKRPVVLTLCGSLRSGSTNQALLDTAAAVAPASLVVSHYAKSAELPHFNPDDDHDALHPAVVDLRSQIDAADALLICTPEYAGALPGCFKNMLDWTVGGVEVCEKPTAWVNASYAGPHGAVRTHDSLQAVLEFTGARIVEAACRRIPVGRDRIGPDGLIVDPGVCQQLTEVLQTLAEHIQPAEAAG